MFNIFLGHSRAALYFKDEFVEKCQRGGKIHKQTPNTNRIRNTVSGTNPN